MQRFTNSRVGLTRPFAFNWKRGNEVPVSKFEVGGGLKLADVFDADLTEIYKGSKNHHLKEIARKSGVDLKVGHFFIRRQITRIGTILQICEGQVYLSTAIFLQSWKALTQI